MQALPSAYVAAASAATDGTTSASGGAATALHHLPHLAHASADGTLHASSVAAAAAQQAAAVAAIYAAHAQQQANGSTTASAADLTGGASVRSTDEEAQMGAALAAAQAAAAAAYASPETALQYAYQAQLADGTGALSMQYPFGMGLGSLQLAQMGSLLQAGQPYTLLSGAEDAVYVNQKQYHRILKRRQARMKLEAKFKIMPRKEWLHDSRHKHAKNRQRGPGGRFLSKAERDKLEAEGEDFDRVGEYSNQDASPDQPPDASSPPAPTFAS